jgi:endopeptidase La
MNINYNKRKLPANFLPNNNNSNKKNINQTKIILNYGSEDDSSDSSSNDNEEEDEDYEKEEEDEEDEEVDEQEDEEEDDENYVDKELELELETNNNDNQIIRKNDVKYFDSDDSEDSENELETNNYRKFALNLIKKIKRHNSKKSNKEILNLFTNKITILEKKYADYSKEPNKYKNLREFKKNIDECKLVKVWLEDDLLFYKNNFKFDKFVTELEENINNNQNYDSDNNYLNIFDIILGNTNTSTNASTNKIDKEFDELYDQDKSFNQSTVKYFRGLNKTDKEKYLELLKKIKKDNIDNKPNYMKVLEMNTTESNKAIILQKITTFDNLKGSSEYFKLKSWINKIMHVPLGNYIKAPVSKTDSKDKIKEYLGGVRKLLDNGIYGHDTTKDQLVKILAHTITNPEEGGNVFALQGPPGVGKTALIQDGVAKALGRPYSFISLGGATDACFLEGHDYTYEGSNHGRIVEVLQQAKYMNPVIYFDELDKVSETPKGEEIINILMHITDATQNSHFNDKYFGGIDFDLSKAIIIFSFNDEYKISRILRDRMKIIRVKGYKLFDKMKIAREYLIPKLIKQIGLEDLEIELSDDILEFLIDNYTNEGGVRKLKELLNDIFLEINLRNLEGSKINGKNINKKIKITKDILEKDFFKKKRKIEHLKINEVPRVGIVNGLWANELGIGGLIPIECCWIPSKEKLDLSLTGMQGKVMKESMNVARSVAWRILPNDIKEKINKRWKNTFDYGIHIHCPDGATPKDGPSAGGAITTCLISLLTNTPANNKIAMTGEINLKGHITAIGGLEEKIFGAKKAGAELVLCPKDNEKDFNEILDKFPNLINDSFNVKIVDNIWDILKEVLGTSIEWNRFD